MPVPSQSRAPGSELRLAAVVPTLDEEGLIELEARIAELRDGEAEARDEATNEKLLALKRQRDELEKEAVKLFG